jgi:hypothetical protein
MAEGVHGLLHEATRPAGKPALPLAVVEQVVEMTLAEGRAGGRTGPTDDSQGRRVSHLSVQRTWRAHGLQPHRVRHFKLSRDPEFVPKFRDIVGLYVDPPAHAIVLGVDEKSQIQALDRTQPALPLKPGRCGTMTRDYKRNGTTTLFAALDVLDGRVIGRCMQATGIRSSSAFSTRSRARSPPARSSTSSSTITAATSTPKCAPGSIAILASCSITHRNRLPGSMSSRASSSN